MHLDYLPGTFFGPSNLVDMLRHRAYCQPDDTAFTYLVDGENEQKHITYAELDRQARAIAAWLVSLDLVGERALLLYPAGTEFIAAFFGCVYAGVVAVPVYPPRRNRSLSRIQAIADDAEAKVALTTDSVLRRIEPLIGETPQLKELTWLATCHVPPQMEQKWEMPDVHGDTMAFLQYTSGSTGTPKGVMLDHANLVHNSALIAYAFEHTRSGLGVFWLPSYHDMGLIGGILQPLYFGRPNILMSPMTFLQKPFRWLSAISRFRATTSGGPNFAYDLCVRKITPEQRKTLDLSCWEVAFNGAEPVRKETLDSFTEMFEPCGFRREAFYPCYGMAEATLIVSGGYVGRHPIVGTFDADALSDGRVVERTPGAGRTRALVGCGETLPDQEIVIANPQTMTTAAADEVGEIWVSGPSVAQGYRLQPEITKQIFEARLQDTGEGPFLRTGDLGFVKDGELYVTGRVKDLIIVRGVNHYPQDIELTMQRSHGRLRRDCGAAFTVEANGREHLVVVQEVDRRKQGKLEPIFGAIRKAIVAEHDLTLDAVVLIRAGSIPKTSSGKIQRHACRAGCLDGSLSVVGEWLAPSVQGVVKSSTPMQPPSAAATSPAKPSEAPVANSGDPLAEETASHRVPSQDSSTNAAASKNGNRATSKNGDRVASKNGDRTAVEEVAKKQTVADVVLEEIRRVARGRANGVALDGPIAESGLTDEQIRQAVGPMAEKLCRAKADSFGKRTADDKAATG